MLRASPGLLPLPFFNCDAAMIKDYHLIIYLLLAGCCSASFAQEPTAKQAAQISEIKSLVDEAGSSFKKKGYSKSAKRIRTATKLMGELVPGGSDMVVEALRSDYDRIVMARKLLVAKGKEFDTLPPLKEMGAQSDSGTDAKNGGGDGPKLVSFTKQVAPILVQHCGRCHVTGAKGGFSASSFQAIVKGSKKGKVLLPGDPAKSSLVSLIELGKMPPKSKGVPPADLKLLKDWVSQGAKYDGKKKDQSIMDFAPNQVGGSRRGGNRAGRR